jgi:hypothetical protein
MNFPTANQCFATVDITDLGLDIDMARHRAEAAYGEEGRAYHAEPSYVIRQIGLAKVIQDVDWDEPWVHRHILEKIRLPKGECHATLYRLPPRGGISPIHVDTETCNILIPLHDTGGKAVVRWFEWPPLIRTLTDEDWRRYGENWEANPICDFPPSLNEIARHVWKQGEAILLNTRQPHSSINESEVWRINLVINFYGISFCEVAELARNRTLFLNPR